MENLTNNKINEALKMLEEVSVTLGTTRNTVRDNLLELEETSSDFSLEDNFISELSNSVRSLNKAKEILKKQLN